MTGLEILEIRIKEVERCHDAKNYRSAFGMCMLIGEQTQGMRESGHISNEESSKVMQRLLEIGSR